MAGLVHDEMWAQDDPAARRVARYAAKTHAVLDLSEIAALGIPRSTAANWARSGRLHRVHRGVYSLVPGALLGDEGRWRAAIRACGPDAVLSHWAAAELLLLVERWKREVPLHVSVRDRRSPRPKGIVVHRPRHLEDEDVVAVHGLPTTSATRTLFDLCSMTSPAVLRELFERAEYLEILDRARLRSLLLNATGRRGLGALEELGGYQPLPLSRTRSRLERVVLSVCRTHSLPMPAVNVPLLDYEVDFLWREARLVLEADGGHHVRERRARDNERDAALQLAGYLVRRFTQEELDDSSAVAREILRLLRSGLPASLG